MSTTPEQDLRYARVVAFIILGGIMLIGAALDIGCWMVNIAPLRSHCVTWKADAPASSYVLVPCPAERKP